MELRNGALRNLAHAPAARLRRRRRGQIEATAPPNESEHQLPSFGSSARDDVDDFQAVPHVDGALGKLRRRNRLAVMLDDHAARQQLLRLQKDFERAGERCRYGLAIGNDGGFIHNHYLRETVFKVKARGGSRGQTASNQAQAVKTVSQSFHTGS